MITPTGGVRRANPTSALRRGREKTLSPFLLPSDLSQPAMFNFSANHLSLLSRTECQKCTVFLMKDHHSQRVYRLYDFSKSQTITPDQFYCVSGYVNSADKLYLVVTSAKIDTKHPWPSQSPLPADGAGG